MSIVSQPAIQLPTNPHHVTTRHPATHQSPSCHNPPPSHPPIPIVSQPTIHQSPSCHNPPPSYPPIPTLLSPRAHLQVVGMLRFMSDINQPSLPTPFYSVLMSVSVFMALSTVFNFINSPDKSVFSHSVLPLLSPPYWSFQLYTSL